MSVNVGGSGIDDLGLIEVEAGAGMEAAVCAEAKNRADGDRDVSGGRDGGAVRRGASAVAV